MTPTTFPQSNCVLAKDQPEYQPLPVCRVGDDDGTMVSCWRLTWGERLRVLFGGRLWLSQLTFGQPLQPQRIDVVTPFCEANE